MADDDEGEKIRCVLDFVAVVGFTDQATSPSEEARELDPSDAHVRLGEVDGSGAPHVRFFERAARGPSDEPITDIVIVKPTLGERVRHVVLLLRASYASTVLTRCLRLGSFRLTTSCFRAPIAVSRPM